jgi:hypothetical protein
METKGYQKVNTSMDEYWDMEDPQTEELQPITTPTQPTIDRTTISLINTETNKKDGDTIASLIIDNEINKKYNPVDFVEIFTGRRQLTEKDFFDIINTIHKYSQSADLINRLYYKNDYCRQAIQYFRDLACKNRDNVTIDALQIICDPTSPQPTTQLNKLPAPIKKHVMTYACNNIRHSYDIILSGHTDTITSVDICAITHRAATSSLDKTLRLWDLATGKFIHIFPGDNNTADCLRFNADGSQLATAKNYDDNTSTVKIWETLSAKLLHNAEINKKISTLDYGTNNTLITYNKPYLTVFSIHNDTMHILTEANTELESTLRYPYICRNNYRTKNPHDKHNNPESTITITKMNNHLLYFCEQVVKNTHNLSSKKLIKLPVFQTFTQYEKNKIHDQLLQKNMLPILDLTFIKFMQEQTQTTK